MNIMIALPGDKYFAIPREVLEKHALTKAEFEKNLAAQQSDVEGQEEIVTIPARNPAMGVRG
jgi:hypothetical protein